MRIGNCFSGLLAVTMSLIAPTLVLLGFPASGNASVMYTVTQNLPATAAGIAPSVIWSTTRPDYISDYSILSFTAAEGTLNADAIASGYFLGSLGIIHYKPLTFDPVNPGPAWDYYGSSSSYVIYVPNFPGDPFPTPVTYYGSAPGGIQYCSSPTHAQGCAFPDSLIYAPLFQTFPTFTAWAPDTLTVTSIVPEPGSACMLLGGVGAFALIQRRRRRS